MKRAALILALLFSGATVSAQPHIIWGRGFMDATYCQLAGCTMAGQFKAADGTKALPGYSWSSDAASGFYRAGANDFRFSNNNTDTLFFGSAVTAALGIGAAPSANFPLDITAGGAAQGVRLTTNTNHASFFSARANTATGAEFRGQANAASAFVGTNNAFPFNVCANSICPITIEPTNGLSWLGSQNVFRVTSDFTSASSTALQTITGLSWVLPATTAANYPFRCEILYNQTVAAVADQFGIQAASLAPTNIMAKGDVATSASATTYGNLPTLSTTTATAIVTFTPSAITTIWNARLSGMIENPSGVANTINVMVQQSTAADLMVIKRGSYCVVGY